MLQPRPIFSLFATLRRLGRARDGIAAVEFALAFPIVLTVIMGIIEISMILFVSSLLEGGLRDASRFAITGAAPSGGVSREQQIVNIVNDRSLGLFSLTTSDVTLRAYDSFDKVGKPEPMVIDTNNNNKCDAGDTYSDVNGNSKWDTDQGKSSAGGSSAVVVYDVDVEWSLLSMFLAPVLGHDGKVSLGASIAVRNEPYAPLPAGATPPAPTVRPC